MIWALSRGPAGAAASVKPLFSAAATGKARYLARSFPAVKGRWAAVGEFFGLGRIFGGAGGLSIAIPPGFWGDPVEGRGMLGASRCDWGNGGFLATEVLGAVDLAVHSQA